MAKHKDGKSLKVEIAFNEKKVLAYVVKGNALNNAPDDNFGDWNGEVHMTLSQSIKDFDYEFNEMLNESSNKDVIVVLCPFDSVFEYAYSRVKSMKV